MFLFRFPYLLLSFPLILTLCSLHSFFESHFFPKQLNTAHQYQRDIYILSWHFIIRLNKLLLLYRENGVYIVHQPFFFS